MWGPKARYAVTACWAERPYLVNQATTSRTPYMRRNSLEMAAAFSGVMPLIRQRLCGVSEMTFNVSSPNIDTIFLAVEGPI